ncbi:hypothetical protein [Pedobacter aquatilis]|uniref:hypothetical protein n=1 Tax=Pedobacter aquatilis TaxID=351343 RepID=UPI00292D02A6|nr:hypothetical protein [Pedobacter aquatilis]
MRKLFQKIDRIRESGYVSLKVDEENPHAHLNDQRFKVSSMGIPDIKCRITLIIAGKEIDFTIDQVY